MLANPTVTVALDPLAVFEARCWARAHLWSEGELDLHEAVDKLQADAERNGLVASVGQHRVQEIMAAAFAVVQRPDIVDIAEKLEIVPDPEPDHLAAASTVEAVVYALRERGATALQSERMRQRMAEPSQRQLEDILARLARMRGTYPKVTDDLLLALAELLP
jgi:hypothetical protein